MNTTLILIAEMIINGVFILANFGLLFYIWRLRKKAQEHYQTTQRNLEESKRLLELSRRVRTNYEPDPTSNGHRASD
jgi:uncharacterized membrane protein YqjE